MKASELRIGNCLQYYIGEDGCEWDTSKIDWQDLRWCDEKNKIFNHVHKGIPITEKILKDSGFSPFDGGDFFIENGDLAIVLRNTSDDWYPSILQRAEMSFEEDQIIFLNRIEYVHELQNLFFAITKQELNIIIKE